MAERIHSFDDAGEHPEIIADDRLRPAGDFADADETAVGADLDQHQLRAVETLMGRPARLRVIHRQRMDPDVRNLHGPPSGNARGRAGATITSAGGNASPRSRRCMLAKECTAIGATSSGTAPAACGVNTTC